jgi:hypothetical protein
LWPWREDLSKRRTQDGLALECLAIRLRDLASGLESVVVTKEDQRGGNGTCAGRREHDICDSSVGLLDTRKNPV